MKRFTSYFLSFFSHTLVQSSGIYFLGTMFVNFGAYTFHFLVGRILGPVQYGELSAILSLFFILNVPNTVLQTVLVKYFSVFKARNMLGASHNLYLTVTRRLLIGICGLFFFSIPFIFFVTDFLHLSSPFYVLFLYGILIFQMLGVINMSVLQGYQKFIELTVYTNISMWFRVLLGVIAAFFGVGWTLVSNIVANIIGYAVFFVPLRFMFVKDIEPINMTKKEIVSYGLPAFFSTLGIMALFSQDVLLVKHFLAAHDAGIYSALSVLGRIIYFATSMVGLLVFPVISERHEMNISSNKIVYYAIGAVVLLSIFTILLFYMFGSYIVRVMFGNEFDQAIQYVWLFGIFMANVSLCHLMVQIFLALNKKSYTILTLCMSVFQVMGITLYHSTLLHIIYINIIITSVLSITFIMLYSYAIKQHKI